MKKSTVTCILFIMLYIASFGQGHLPDVTFPSGANVCDPAAWQLIFSEDFNGSTIDHTKWRTFNAWDNMRYGDNDNWSQGRCAPPFLDIFKDENVIVSGGTCKLLIKHQPLSWRCDTCTMATVYTNYSAGSIATYYHKPNGDSFPPGSYFSSGKFEARIKFPTAKQTHCDFWTWHGATVNEIDIAEAYGDPYWPSGLPGDNHRYCDYSLHAFAPTPELDPTHNPYHLPHDVEIMNRYSNQRWYDHFTGNFFQQADWHTYTCEWDTSKVEFFLDGNLENTIWKYFTYKTYIAPSIDWWAPVTYTYLSPSICNPNGTYHVLGGFPWNDSSQSSLNFTTGMDEDAFTSPGTYDIGQMEIDYVNIWQRHPEIDGFTNLCSSSSGSIISGPSINCGTATYTASPSYSGGTWLVSPNLDIVSSSGSSLTVHNDGSALNQQFSSATMTYVPPTCLGYSSISKTIDVGTPHNTIVTGITVTTPAHKMTYMMSARPNSSTGKWGTTTYNSSTTFTWDVTYGAPMITPYTPLHYHTTGQVITVPQFSYTSGVIYPMSWTLTIANGCGAVTKYGYICCKPAFKTTQSANGGGDSVYYNYTDSAWYFNAYVFDTLAYDSAIIQRVSQTFVQDTTDTLGINSMINQIAIDELLPYIIRDSADQMMGQRSASNPSAAINGPANTIIYPNPTSSIINIEPDKSFADKIPIMVKLYDITGKLIKGKVFEYKVGNTMQFDISVVANGIYDLELEQNKNKEHYKVVKTSN